MKALAVVVLLGLVILCVIVVAAGDQQTLNEIARKNGMTFVDSDQRVLRTGPYWDTEDYRIYYATFSDSDGRRHHAWVRMPSHYSFGGYDIEWED